MWKLSGRQSSKPKPPESNYTLDDTGVVHLNPECKQIRGKTSLIGRSKSFRYHFCEMCAKQNQDALNEMLPDMIGMTLLGLMAVKPKETE
jgi:hypothetical protein